MRSQKYSAIEPTTLTRQLGRSSRRATLLEHEKQLRNRAECLSQAAKLLGTSLDLDQTLSNISKLIVPQLGDSCMIALKEDNTHLRIHSGNPDEVEFCSLELLSPWGLPQTLLTGEASIYAKALGQTQVLNHVGFGSFMTIPLKVRNQIFGAVLIARTNEIPQYLKTDLEFAQELMEHCAIAIEHAKLYQEAKRSVTLRDDFIAMVSHELRTPLTPLTLQTHLIRRILANLFDPTQPSDSHLNQLHSVLSSADHQVGRLTRLTEEILDVSKISAGHLVLKRKTVEISELIHSIIQHVEQEREKSGCRLDLNLEILDGVKAEWDPFRIEQILLQLLRNSFKFGSGKPVELKVSLNASNVLISVKDHGIGIDKKDQARLFDRFERAAPLSRYPGLGLGLYIANHLVKAHFGKISFESILGQGSLFKVEIPLTNNLKV